MSVNYSSASNLPNVIKTSSRGIDLVRIVDELYQDRQIQCTGQIDAEAADVLCMQLRHLAKEDPVAPITMFINSPGGEVLSGLAIVDVMNAIPCPVRTVCLGMAASMGAILFVAGDQRDMLEHSQVMIHDPLIQHTSGSALSVMATSEILMRTRQITAGIIASRTGHTVDEVLELTAKDTYFDAEEALAWGIADSIVSEL